MKRIFVYLLCVICVLSQAVFAQDIAGLVVDVGQDLGMISPYVYGANYGPLSAINVDLMPYMEASGITYLRYPGGRVGDLSYLQKGDVDRFIALARLYNAEPSISVRLEGGTPEKAAEILQYVNIEKGYGVRYWSIGNEPNLFDDYTTEDLNREWRAIAEAMLVVDPTITLVGPDISQYPGIPELNPKDPNGRDWMEEFLKVNGDLVDIVSVHRYPFPLGTGGRKTTIDDLRNNTREWDTTIPYLRQVIKDITGRDIPVAVTEINSHWSSNIDGEATADSHYNAIWMADILGRLIKHQVQIVGYFDLQSASSRGAWGLMDKYEPRPTYYTYQIYQRFGTKLVASLSDDPYVTINAALRDDGALTIVVVNMLDDEQTRPLTIDNFVGGDAEIWLFDQHHNAEQVGTQTLDDMITVPGQSITLFIIPPAS